MSDETTQSEFWRVSLCGRGRGRAVCTFCILLCVRACVVWGDVEATWASYGGGAHLPLLLAIGSVGGGVVKMKSVAS